MLHTEINDDGIKEEIELYLFKILIIGESAVGKTSFVRRYTGDKFTTNYKATIGADYASKSVKWTDDSRIDMFLWDLAGQERIGTQIRSYFADTHGAVLVYDIERNLEQNKIEDWKALLDDKCTLHGQEYIPPCILLINKCDLSGGINNVDMTPFNEIAKSLGFLGAYPISAKTGEGVDDAMKILLKRLVKVQRIAMSSGIPQMQNIDKVRLAALKESQEGSWCC
jgi:small GTP-binding protein